MAGWKGDKRLWRFYHETGWNTIHSKESPSAIPKDSNAEKPVSLEEFRKEFRSNLKDVEIFYDKNAAWVEAVDASQEMI